MRMRTTCCERSRTALGTAAALLLATAAVGAEPVPLTTPQLQLKEHTNGVNGVAVTPDGRTVVSGSQDKTIRFWDLATGKRTGIIRHTAGVQAVALSPDGKTLAAADREGHIVLFDARSHKEIRTLTGDDARAVWLAFSPDGETLASIGYHAEQAVLWDVAHGTKRGVLKHRNAHVHNVAFSPDGSRAATSGTDQVVHIWNASTGKELAAGKGHDGEIEHVAFSPDGKTIVSAGGHDKTVRLWDAESGKALETFEGHTEGVRWVTFLPDGKTVLSLSLKDAQVKLWDVAAGKERGGFFWFKGLVTMPGYNSNLAVSPDGTRLIVGRDDSVAVWNLTAWLNKAAASE